MPLTNDPNSMLYFRSAEYRELVKSLTLTPAAMPLDYFALVEFFRLNTHTIVNEFPSTMDYRYAAGRLQRLYRSKGEYAAADTLNSWVTILLKVACR